MVFHNLSLKELKMSTQIVKYVKQTFIVKFAKAVFIALLLSVVANAFFLGRHVSNEQHIAETQKVITAIAIENNKLKVERDQAVVSYMQTQAKLNGALIPEASVKEAVSVHVVQPTKETATNAYNVTVEGINVASHFVKNQADKAWSYVQQ